MTDYPSNLTGASSHDVFSCEFAGLFRYAEDVPASKETINRALGREIRAAYIREDMTAAQLAEKTGISESTMTRLMAGSDIPVSRLYLIADAIGVSPVALVEAAVARAERDDA